MAVKRCSPKRMRGSRAKPVGGGTQGPSIPAGAIQDESGAYILDEQGNYIIAES